MVYPALTLYLLFRNEYLKTISELTRSYDVTMVVTLKEFRHRSSRRKPYELRYPVPAGTDLSKVTLSPVTWDALRAASQVTWVGFEVTLRRPDSPC